MALAIIFSTIISASYAAGCTGLWQAAQDGIDEVNGLQVADCPYTATSLLIMLIVFQLLKRFML